MHYSFKVSMEKILVPCSLSAFYIEIANPLCLCGINLAFLERLLFGIIILLFLISSGHLPNTFFNGETKRNILFFCKI